MLREIRNKQTLAVVPFETAQIVLGDHLRYLEVDGKHISKHHPYLITYECGNCHSPVQVGISQFIHHIQKDTPSCRYCSSVSKGKSMRELREEYQKQFETELDHDEQCDYFASHLTEEEFERLREDMCIPSEMVYWPVWKVPTKMRYTSVLYNPKTDLVDKIGRVSCQCQECDALFSVNNIHSLKNRYRVLCKECSGSRNSFCKKTVTNMRGDKVLVHSKEEVQFVNWCNEHGVVVINGPSLTYIWKDKECTYRVNFELPELGWLVEVREQPVGGKWSAKEGVAKGQGKRFEIITARNKMRILREILKVLETLRKKIS